MYGRYEGLPGFCSCLSRIWISGTPFAKMCAGYVSTKYYTLCGCYGKRLPTEESKCCECIDKTYLGIEIGSETCPRCLRGETFGMNDKYQGFQSPTQPPNRRSTSECARLLLSCMPASVKALSKGGSLTKFDSVSSAAPSLSSSSDATTRSSSDGKSSNSGSSSGRNLHWRAYDNGRYSEEEEQRIRDAKR